MCAWRRFSFLEIITVYVAMAFYKAVHFNFTCELNFLNWNLILESLPCLQVNFLIIFFIAVDEHFQYKNFFSGQKYLLLKTPSLVNVLLSKISQRNFNKWIIILPHFGYYIDLYAVLCCTMQRQSSWNNILVKMAAFC